MKIMVISNSCNGLLLFRRELLTAIKQNHEICICCPTDERMAELDSLANEVIPISIDRRGINPFKDLKFIIALRKIMKKYRPDKVITYTIKPNIYGGIVCRMQKIPLYANVTGLGSSFNTSSILSKLVAPLNKFALKHAKAVFFENNGNKKVLIERKIIRENQAVSLKGAGVNLDRFAFSELPEKETVAFAFIGRIMREKGVNELFTAIEKVLQKKDYNVSFDFFGGYEEDYLDKIKQMVEKKLICYRGIVNDIPERLPFYDCVILPSYHEGMSNALLEAASTGRALISSDIPGCREAIEEGKNGFLCTVKDAVSLQNCIEKYCSLSYAERKEMGRNSRKLMERVFDKNKVVEDTLSVIFKR